MSTVSPRTGLALPGIVGSRYSDLVLVVGVVAIMGMMVLPLPPMLADVLVAVNISIGVLLLLVALYINSPLEFSAFPSVLLMSTLFRLALSIATTRLILLHGHAGDIIDTFGHMVAGGSLVVGMVVFLIITVVQLIVVAKGAERVAEVSARFTLDAMPGKQLSIDSDLRSGLIDKDEARRKRRELEQESKLHGSLDGAMKFVKGDAIASLVIIVINLLGGLAIGSMRDGLDLEGAMVKYSVLSIGEGLVAQIPALLSAMAAGLIVTRANDDGADRHLGEAITRQITAKPRVLLVMGVLCVLLSLVPGFPAWVFVLLGLISLSSGALLLPPVKARWERLLRPARETARLRKHVPPTQLSTVLQQVRPTMPLLLEVPADVLRGDFPENLLRELGRVLDHINFTLGLPLPRVSVNGVMGSQTAPQQWRLLAFEVPIAQGEMPTNDVAQLLAGSIQQALRRHGTLFLGTQEASALMTRAANDIPEVVKELLRVLPLPRVADVLRRLIEEEIAIRNTRDIFEALSDSAQREKDIFALTELTRIALKRQISHWVAPGGVLRAVLLEPELEETLRQAVRVSNGVQQLALDPQKARELMDALTTVLRTHRPAALVTVVDIRRHVRKLIETECFDVPVLSFHELVPTLRLEVVSRVGPPQVRLLKAL